ncbi:hypothetical protein CKAH01_09434 [Colletotrichum kahawae]|uniref:Secreted protein n=1 Tax=Colletotrichum kahawae TaxID=34407 RepID=A0AAE0D0C6_COLKA|nr:hypothetical protein CKAH01_09434 [Colletotrichum kahawae]
MFCFLVAVCTLSTMGRNYDAHPLSYSRRYVAFRQLSSYRPCPALSEQAAAYQNLGRRVRFTLGSCWRCGAAN